MCSTPYPNNVSTCVLSGFIFFSYFFICLTLLHNIITNMHCVQKRCHSLRNVLACTFVIVRELVTEEIRKCTSQSETYVRQHEFDQLSLLCLGAFKHPIGKCPMLLNCKFGTCLIGVFVFTVDSVLLHVVLLVTGLYCKSSPKSCRSW